MSKIPPPTETTVTRIYKAYEDNEKPRFSRRLGASIIGKPCMRQTWYSFRWAKIPHFEGRMLRLFGKGHIEEPCIGSDLKRIGVQWLPEDPDTGRQWEFSELGDHMVCKLDGAACGFVEAPASWHVVEIKTSNQKAYDKLVKEGVKVAKPEHYAQCMCGMGMSGMDRAAYIAVNKNDESIHFERIRFDKKEWLRLLQKAKEIIFATEPPDRINESPAWFECKWCAYADICHDQGDIAEKNCRTCKYATALEEGGWACDNYNTVRTHEEQTQECPDHCYREGMCSATVAKAAKIMDAKIDGLPNGNRLALDEENLSI